MLRTEKSTQTSLSSIVRLYFQKLLYLDIVQHKYISLDVYLDILKHNYAHVELICRLQSKTFKTTISKIDFDQIFKLESMSKKVIMHKKSIKVGGRNK